MTALTEGTWQRACAADDVWEGELDFRQLDDGTAVILINHAGTVSAFQGLCPHQGSSLEDAGFDGKVVTCAAHMWEFDATSGAGINPPSSCLDQYAVTTRDGDLYVLIPYKPERQTTQ